METDRNRVSTVRRQREFDFQNHFDLDMLPVPMQIELGSSSQKLDAHEEVSRACIFCGMSKAGSATFNREHAIPQWLFSGTSPAALISRKPSELALMSRAKIPLAQLHVPAHIACNDEWAILEGLASPVVRSLLKNESINHSQADTLLDWFDKIRHSYFHTSLKVTKNFFRMTPNHFVNSRVRRCDRALFVFRLGPSQHKIGLPFLDDPLFIAHPTLFFLRVNHLLFISWSANHSLCNSFRLRSAKVFTPTSKKLLKNQMQAVEFYPPTASIDRPDLPPIPNSCLAIMQSILPFQAMFGDHLAEMGLDPALAYNVVTHPYTSKSGKLEPLTESNSKIPKIWSLNLQNHLFQMTQFYRSLVNIELSRMHSHDLKTRGNQKLIRRVYAENMARYPTFPLNGPVFT